MSRSKIIHKRGEILDNTIKKSVNLIKRRAFARYLWLFCDVVARIERKLLVGDEIMKNQGRNNCLGKLPVPFEIIVIIFVLG